ncbi:MAG: nucleotidyltransferase [Verrucomicrobia bacterium]|nr:nucleotidyltransferase [Verrucomicrobiota bacterium]
MQNFSQLLQRLTDAGLEFVIVGGYAAVTHGSSYATRDIDICAILTDENVEKLRRALADWNPTHRMTPQKLSFMAHPAPGQPVQNLYLQTDLGVVDIIATVLGVGDFERLRSRADKLRVNDRNILVMSLDDLIQAKEALGREKDLLTAKELRAIAAKMNSEKR